MTRPTRRRSGMVALVAACLLLPGSAWAQSPSPGASTPGTSPTPASTREVPACESSSTEAVVSPDPSAAASPEASSAPIGRLRGRWTRMSEAPIKARSGHSVIWTGTEAIYWGGDGPGSGAAYDPGRDTWRRIARAPISKRVGHTAVWTGSEMIVWGGAGRRGVLRSGAAYDPATDTWRRIATPEGPVARYAHEAVWTGSLMLIDGRQRLRRDPGGSGPVIGGLAYDPASDSWTAIPPDPLGDLDTRWIAWTDGGMLLVGYGVGPWEPGMALFDPVTTTWTVLTGAPLGSWDGSRPTTTPDAVLMVDIHPPRDADEGPGGFVLDTVRWCWRTPGSIPPNNTANLEAVWTGSLLIAPGLRGLAYDPVADTWSRLPRAPGDLAFREDSPSVWAGDRVLIWSGRRGESAPPLRDGAVFIPR